MAIDLGPYEGDPRIIGIEPTGHLDGGERIITVNGSAWPSQIHARHWCARPDDAAPDHGTQRHTTLWKALYDLIGYPQGNGTPGQQWEDLGVTWLPDGHRSIVFITSASATIYGWQCSVTRRQVDPNGATVESGDGAGTIFLEHLLTGYRRLIQPLVSPEGTNEVSGLPEPAEPYVQQTHQIQRTHPDTASVNQATPDHEQGTLPI